MINKEMISGALIDFIGYLTTRPETIKIGANEEVYALHDLYNKWAEMRGLDSSGANLEWEKSLT